ALRYAERGIAHCEAQGVELFNVRIRVRRAFVRIVMGDWALADADLDEVAQHHSPSPMEATTHSYVAALLALRRGDAQAVRRLLDAVADMRRKRLETWFIPTAVPLVEAAWLAGDQAALDAAARPGLARMLEVDDRWRIGELAAWLQRAGLPIDRSQLPPLPAPYALELSGRWCEAAAEWQRLGCPYDRALALCCGDSDALREALAIFRSLGAEPAAARTCALLRERGVRGVPRGPQPRTRDDPLGLTGRERTVFDLVRQGLSNAAIASRLHRSERTVEHHVAAVLRKSGSASRVELMARHRGVPAAHA
ncbi:MAG TPA: LuxR C-terminal-related transcriptional regulator, partial [Burkholderiaceae bacterium]|nr:LuxR C-terminal-related transcriptional regulator [Burkholderiaceae bacterium]